MAVRGRIQQPSRRRQAVVGTLALFALLLLGLLPGGWQAALVVLILALPVIGFFAWVFQQQQHHGVTYVHLSALSTVCNTPF